jgi:thioredoxin reductase/NAD-dependent dihydropyrimidine dehydrogenase PreA subunit
MDHLVLALYAVPLLLIWAWHALRRQRRDARNRSVLRESIDAGLTEPASIHPVIDLSQCIGCAACVTACPEMPEHQVLGIIDGKASLVSPTDCIGHGACKAACPTQAIELVFGSARRGVDLPVLNSQFESNVAGIYIAGELGGMGLIRNALTQGREAVETIARLRPRDPSRLDLVIVGAGPAGFAAALTAKALGLRYLILEQESFGGCVYQYPRRKLVMTQPVELPLIGSVHFRTVSKEELLQFWQTTSKQQQLNIRLQQAVVAIEQGGGGFLVRTPAAVHAASTVLLAIGRRGTPRKLGVTGEELPKVVYRLLDPEQYTGSRVLVVGGGDSALEAAASIAELPNAQVTLSYRGDAFSRAKQRNRQRVTSAEQSGRLTVLLNSNVKHIAPDRVRLLQGSRELEVANDSVIISAGGVLPNDFLEQIGIAMQTKFGTA